MHILCQTTRRNDLYTRKLNICVKGTKIKFKIDKLAENDKSVDFYVLHPLIFWDKESILKLRKRFRRKKEITHGIDEGYSRILRRFRQHCE